MSVTESSLAGNPSAGGGYSARVDLFLIVHGERIEVSQVGAGVLYFQEPVLLREDQATLIVDVDGNAARREITIVDHEAASKRVRFVEA